MTSLQEHRDKSKRQKAIPANELRYVERELTDSENNRLLDWFVTCKAHEAAEVPTHGFGVTASAEVIKRYEDGRSGHEGTDWYHETVACIEVVPGTYKQIGKFNGRALFKQEVPTESGAANILGLFCAWFGPLDTGGWWITDALSEEANETTGEMEPNGNIYASGKALYGDKGGVSAWDFPVRLHVPY